MTMDPLLPVLVGTVLLALLVGVVFSRIGLPLVLAYLATGVLVGPFGLGLLRDPEFVAKLGEVGLVVLLFFLGMEMPVERLVRSWRVTVGGTLFQILVSVGAVLGAGAFLSWPVGRSVLLGFVVSLSSTAVVLPLLEERGELHTPTGQDVLGILLAQDLAVVPMVVVIGLFHRAGVSAERLALQLLGAVILIGLIIALGRGLELRVPRMKVLEKNREMQVLAAFIVCFGMATLTAFLGLSTGMGAFVGGILVAEGRQIGWVHSALEPFRVLLVAFFFIDVGAMLDLSFVAGNAGVVLLLVLLALLTNTAINAGAFLLLGRGWRSSLYGGALLAQIGEFSFVLAAVGVQAGMISGFGYQTTLAVISLSLVLSPLWIGGARRLGRGVGRREGPGEPAPTGFAT